MDAWINPKPESDDEEHADNSRGSLEIFYQTTASSAADTRDGGFGYQADAVDIPEGDIQIVSLIR